MSEKCPGGQGEVRHVRTETGLRASYLTTSDKSTKHVSATFEAKVTFRLVCAACNKNEVFTTEGSPFEVVDNATQQARNACPKKP